MAVLIVVALGTAGVIVALGRFWRRGGPPAKFGAVSHQWLAEHRGSEQDARR
jgi:hypothetical protein